MINNSKYSEFMGVNYYEKIKENLESNNAKKITNAAKLLQKKYISGFEDIIVDILETRYHANKSWEVQSELIKIISKELIVSALPVIKEIVHKNLDHDMVTINAASAYLRLMRKDETDVSPIISLFGNIGYSVGEGLLSCLGADLMIPPISDQNKLISYFWDFGSPVPLGYVDPRFGLAQAAKIWNTPNAKDFIKHCSLTQDSKLRTFALKCLD